jgi:hypothetical protein
VNLIPSTSREKIGSWTTPRGNHVLVWFQAITEGLGEVTLEWDDPPPLAAAESAHYQNVILPEVVARLREFTEAIGPVLVMSA